MLETVYLQEPMFFVEKTPCPYVKEAEELGLGQGKKQKNGSRLYS